VKGRKPIHAREEINAIRTILFSPPIGTRLLMNEDRRLDLAAHLNLLEEWCERAHKELWRTREAVAYVDDHPEIPNAARVQLRQLLWTGVE
jgi:hypothetical protein